MTDNYPSIDEIAVMLDCAKRELISMRDEISNIKSRHQAEIKAAVLAEREACAKVCEKTGAYTDEIEMAQACASAIRGR